MFHKQNIPPSAPPTQGNDNNNEAEHETNIDKQAESTDMNDTPTPATDTNLNAPSTPFGARPTSFSGPPTAYGQAQTKTESDGRVLTIGQGITLAGEIDNCDQLLVEGTVEATLNGAKMLDIAETGIFYGSVDIEEAVIAGRFEGDLTVDGRVTIESTGTVIGTITYRELTVEAGATIEGKISTFASAGAKGEKSTTDFSKLKEASKKGTGKKAEAA